MAVETKTSRGPNRPIVKETGFWRPESSPRDRVLCANRNLGASRNRSQIRRICGSAIRAKSTARTQEGASYSRWSSTIARSMGFVLRRDRNLATLRPTSIGQAARISGITPADIAIISIWLSKNYLQYDKTQVKANFVPTFDAHVGHCRGRKLPVGIDSFRVSSWPHRGNRHPEGGQW